MIEAIDDETDNPLGLELPVIKNSDETKGDDTSQERAAMRLRDKNKKADAVVTRVDNEKKGTSRTGLRKGKDATVDLTAAFNSGQERQFRAATSKELSKLEKSLSTGEVMPRTAIDTLKKITNDPRQNKDAQAKLKKLGMPREPDIERDIATASVTDEEDEQQPDLVDLVRQIISTQKNAIDSANVSIDTRVERDKQKKKGIRS